MRLGRPHRASDEETAEARSTDYDTTPTRAKDNRDIYWRIAGESVDLEVARLSAAAWPGPLAIFTGAGVLFVGYEGFGLITNAAANMASAIYGSVAIAIVIYVLVATGVVTNVPLNVLKGLRRGW